MMKKIFSFQSEEISGYQSERGQLACVDQRFDKALQAYRAKFQKPDTLILPGGVKALFGPGFPGLIETIRFLKEHHGFSEFELLAHMKCAACGGNGDRAFYEDLLKKGGKLLNDAIPGLKVILTFHDFDGFYEVSQ